MTRNSKNVMPLHASHSEKTEVRDSSGKHSGTVPTGSKKHGTGFYVKRSSNAIVVKFLKRDAKTFLHEAENKLKEKLFSLIAFCALAQRKPSLFFFSREWRIDFGYFREL